MLEDVGKLRVKTQLGQGQENETLYMNVDSAQRRGPRSIARGVDVAMVAALKERPPIWRKLSEEVLKEQERHPKDSEAAPSQSPLGPGETDYEESQSDPSGEPLPQPEPTRVAGLRPRIRGWDSSRYCWRIPGGGRLAGIWAR